MGQLDGKSVILTGASRGIGAAAAEAMAAEGARLLLLARSAEGITGLATYLRRSGAQAEAMTCDVAEWTQVQAAVARAHEAFGRIDALVNNAGVIEPIGPLAAADPRAWAHAADVNFKGVFFGTRAVLPGMRAQGSGTIVNLGSGAAHNPLEGWSQYCSAKAAAAMLTRCTHLENRGRGVRVFSLSPGTVATDMQRTIRASGINPVSQMDFSAHAPVEHPARALVWLLTEDAAPFAGEEISLRDPEMRARIGLPPA
ncbi:SDR family oxidoreductase [Amaricoccus sp.]|uniref:SDR family oxidoreductase n=1 Tax=Amaricoccus sp. TaxID=1872485 RepID=UPI0026150965|nr:SDR family oxidoreductase [Amaricoccus sp.]HRO10410.1 SDR family oxidoreductase [Amaricoccus sp.]